MRTDVANEAFRPDFAETIGGVRAYHLCGCMAGNVRSTFECREVPK